MCEWNQNVFLDLYILFLNINVLLLGLPVISNNLNRIVRKRENYKLTFL